MNSIQAFGSFIEEEANAIAKAAKTEVVSLRFVGSYKKKIPNTHYAPKGKDTNFKRVGYGNLWYPGWEGRVWVLFDTNPKGFSSQYIPNIINIGTGGYGTYNRKLYPENFHPPSISYPVSYQSVIFLDDLPEFKIKVLLTQEDYEKVCLEYLNPKYMDNHG